jgi:hypothetical protein
MLNPFIFILICVLLLLVYTVVNNIQNNNINNTDNVIEGFYAEQLEKLKRPFVNFYTDKGELLNIAGITKPYSGDNHLKLFEEHSKDFIFVGVCSYLEFPNMVSNPYDNFRNTFEKYKYKEVCRAWLHCFRDPDTYFQPHIPRLLISESDFTDCNNNKPIPGLKKEFDFLYICLKQNPKKDTCDDWATYNKNWTLGKKCLEVLCGKLKLKGLLIGRKNCPLSNKCNGLMTTTDMLSNKELREMYCKSKFIFLPNEKDASPRVLTEAFCHNIPAVVNTKILGGWKYINDRNGVFFNDEKDLESSVLTLMNNLNNYTPRDYFINNYGTINSGKRLKDFLYKNFGNEININENEVEYVTIANNRKNYIECTE